MSLVDRIFGVIERITSLATIPKHDDDPTAWRRTVGGTIILLIFVAVIFFIHLAAAKGVLGFIGIPRVAHATEVGEVSKKMDTLLRATYAPQFRSAVRDRCEAETEDEREKANRFIDALQNEYREATGKRFEPMPRCDEV